MKRERRIFSPEDRLAILQEGQREGNVVTCRKYHLSPSLYAKWKTKYLSKGMEGLKPAFRQSDTNERETQICSTPQNTGGLPNGIPVPRHQIRLCAR
jgi:transposase-like protein